MPEIAYAALDAHLKGRGASSRPAERPAIVLIHGEELLVRMACDALQSYFLPAPDGLDLETFDGTAAPVAEVLEHVNTYGLLGGTKVVVLKDARIFHTREDAERLFQGARKAHGKGDIPAAARRLLAALAQLELSLKDLQGPSPSANLPDGWATAEDDGWLAAVIGHCSENRMAVPAQADAASQLEQAIEKGFPQGHHLIITTESADRRRSLFKKIVHHGIAVDCSVPKSERKADRDARQATLLEHLRSVTLAQRKTMDPQAVQALCDMTGFDLGTFSNNLEILIAYVGERREITLEDVQATLSRTKKDPLFELTNALSERDRDAALFFLGSLLGSGIHPLQAAAAMANQVRRLLVAKEFAESPDAAAWHPRCSYPEFQQSVLPAMVRYDGGLLAWLEKADDALGTAPEPAGGKKKKKTKTQVASDLMIAKTPGNPFPIYQTLKKSDRFSREELEDAIRLMSRLDVQLKSSDLDPQLIIGRAIWRICEKTDP